MTVDCGLLSVDLKELLTPKLDNDRSRLSVDLKKYEKISFCNSQCS